MSHNGKLLRKFLDEKYSGSISQFIETTGKSRQWIYDLFKEQEFSKNKVLILSNALDVKKEVFFSYLQNPDILSTQIVSYQMELKKGKNYIGFLKKYYDVLKDFVAEAKESILIVSSLEDNESLVHKVERSGGKADNYFQEFADYLKVMRNVIVQQLTVEKNENFKYEIFFQLPLRTNYQDDLITKGMSLLYKENITHLEEIYSFYKGFRTYFLKTPIRPFSFVIIDGKHILTEYHYYNKEGMAIPDLAFIDRDNTMTRQIINSHLSLLNRVRIANKELTREEAMYGIAILLLKEYKKLERIYKTRSSNAQAEKFPKNIENLTLEIKSDYSERNQNESIKKLKQLIEKSSAFNKLTPKLEGLLKKSHELLEKIQTEDEVGEVFHFSRIEEEMTTP